MATSHLQTINYVQPYCHHTILFYKYSYMKIVKKCFQCQILSRDITIRINNIAREEFKTLTDEDEKNTDGDVEVEEYLRDKSRHWCEVGEKF